MQFVVVMRDGARFAVDAHYVEVVPGDVPSYTMLGPVPGYERAILAAFPADVVAAVVPASEMANFAPADSGASLGGGDGAANGAAPSGDSSAAPARKRGTSRSTL
jgi:hypothetical protein